MPRPFTRTVVVAAAIACFSRASATLGEPVQSLDRDRTALSAVRRAATARTRYTVETLRSDAVTVREFVAPSGVVFAVAWEGLVHPDLNALLGSYAREYGAALDRNPRKQGRRSHAVAADNVVVETWGHMRHLQGRAYLPAMLPAGVVVDELR